MSRRWRSVALEGVPSRNGQPNANVSGRSISSALRSANRTCEKKFVLESDASDEIIARTNRVEGGGNSACKRERVGAERSPCLPGVAPSVAPRAGGQSSAPELPAAKSGSQCHFEIETYGCWVGRERGAHRGPPVTGRARASRGGRFVVEKITRRRSRSSRLGLGSSLFWRWERDRVTLVTWECHVSNEPARARCRGT